MRFILVLVIAAFAAAAQQLTFAPFHQNGIYQVGERVGWTVMRPAGAGLPEKFKFAIKKNNQAVLKTGILDLSSGSATIEMTVDEPAMLYVQVDPPDGTPHDKPYATLGAAVAPHRLQPSVPRPTDFDTFWESKLKALRAMPINPVLTPVPSRVPVRLEYVEAR